MRFDNAFDVEAPIGEVWTAMLDVERVAPCVPGAEVLDRISDSSYRVGIKIRIGPIVQQYRGEIEVVESDESQHRAVMKARAREMRGQGRAEATVELRLTEEGERTHGDMAAEVALSGPAAAMGRGIIQDVSSRIVEDFAKNLAAMLAGGPAAPTAEPPILAPTAVEVPPVEGVATPGVPATTAPEPEEPAPAEPGAGIATPGVPATAAPAAEETASAGALPEAVPELHVPEEPVPDVAAPDEPTAALPIPTGPPDTAPPPQSGVTGGPPAGLAEAAAIGGLHGAEPAAPAEEPAGPAAAAATGGPSAEATGRAPEPPRFEPPPPRAEPPPSEAAALPVVSILGDVALKRLREPKVIAGVVGAVVMIGLLRRRRRP